MARNGAISTAQRVVSLTCVVALLGVGGILSAQEPYPPPQTPPPAGQAPPLPQQQQQPPLSPQQLQDLVAPVALYPDPLLGQVLAASTYPLELMEAQQWLQQNRGLTGQALVDAARRTELGSQHSSARRLPRRARCLTSDIRWTTDLGNAFLAQQADVMAAVQRLRAQAQANGKLRSNPQEVVTDQNQAGQTAVQIMPANPNVMYVPAYNPAYVRVSARLRRLPTALVSRPGRGI